MTDITDTIRRVRELDAGRAWKAPWVAHTFEVDCPCPNGEHCGETHTCEEVEAPEEYPDGQCVVQISVPGLETFARPTAELVAYYRTAAPLLADECERLRERVLVLEGLLTRVVKYVTEDRAVLPGVARLGRVVSEARAALAKGGEE